MKIKKDFTLREIAGEKVVIPMGSNIADFNGIIRLNESAAFLWNTLKEETTKEDLIQALIEEYEINTELAIKDVEGFIDVLEKNKVLESL